MIAAAMPRCHDCIIDYRLMMRADADASCLSADDIFRRYADITPAAFTIDAISSLRHYTYIMILIISTASLYDTLPRRLCRCLFITIYAAFHAAIDSSHLHH